MIREMKEETNLDVRVERLLLDEPGSRKNLPRRQNLPVHNQPVGKRNPVSSPNRKRRRPTQLSKYAGSTCETRPVGAKNYAATQLLFLCC